MTRIAPAIPPVRSDPVSGGSKMLWALRAPCGCTTGWFATSIRGRGPLVDEDEVWKVPCYGPVRTTRMRAEGWRWLWQAEEAVYAAIKRDCPHIPKYWSLVLTAPTGYTWAALTRDSTVEHLVWDRREGLLNDDLLIRSSDDVPSLCSTAPRGPWWKVALADPCPACEAAAANLAATKPPP